MICQVGLRTSDGLKGLYRTRIGSKLFLRFLTVSGFSTVCPTNVGIGFQGFSGIEFWGLVLIIT